MRALIVLFAAAFAIGVAGCQKAEHAAPMDQPPPQTSPSETMPPADNTLPPSDTTQEQQQLPPDTSQTPLPDTQTQPSETPPPQQ